MLARGRAPLPGVASSLTTKEETTAILATISTTVKVSTACSREPVFASQSDVLVRGRAALHGETALPCRAIGRGVIDITSLCFCILY